jgi:3-phenylpropionate/trans-cinnamate dioxygenase ferredoxin reductase subunit
MDETDVAVRAVREVGEDTVALELETPSGFDARPGQFVQIRGEVNGEAITRHYTLSSPDVFESDAGDSPESAETFEITVGVDPEGDLSPWLADREAGDTVGVDGPYGQAYYEGEESVVLLAGGPGVGPAVGIGERAVADGHDAVVVYQDDAPAHEDRLRALADRGATVVMTDRALADDERVRETLRGATGQIFVYGFADFLDAAEEALGESGHDFADAKSENFGPS